MDHKNESPDAGSTANRAKSSNEDIQLHITYATEATVKATHYWDRYSNSVQPIALMMPGICA